MSVFLTVTTTLAKHAAPHLSKYADKALVSLETEIAYHKKEMGKLDPLVWPKPYSQHFERLTNATKMYNALKSTIQVKDLAVAAGEELVSKIKSNPVVYLSIELLTAVGGDALINSVV